MHSATANTPMIAPRSVIVTDAATIQHQNRIRAGFALLDAKRCQLRLDLAQCAFLRGEGFSLLFTQCFLRRYRLWVEYFPKHRVRIKLSVCWLVKASGS